MEVLTPLLAALLKRTKLKLIVSLILKGGIVPFLHLALRGGHN